VTADAVSFDPTRYAPTSVEVLMRLPASNARNFEIAAALGYKKTETGGAVLSGRDVAGSLITRNSLPKVLEAIGIGERRWEQLVADWVARYLAHRCGPRRVFLFVNHAIRDACPNCHAEIEVDHQPPTPTHPRGAGFDQRSDPSVGKRKGPSEEAQNPFARRRRTPSLAGAEPLRESGTTTEHQKNRLLLGGIEVCVCGHDHFRGGGCRRPGCECSEMTP
jgi:hypothetical protein